MPIPDGSGKSPSRHIHDMNTEIGKLRARVGALEDSYMRADADIAKLTKSLERLESIAEKLEQYMRPVMAVMGSPAVRGGK